MKTILSNAALFAASALLTIANAAPKSHAEICEVVAKEMTAMMGKMAKIQNVDDAKAFAATMPDLKANMQAMLKAAQALPAPTEAEKAAFTKRMEEEQEKAAPAVMAMMMGLAQNPDAEAIGKVLEGVMGDEEMEKTMKTLEGMYKGEKEDGNVEPAPAPAPKIE